MVIFVSKMAVLEKIESNQYCFAWSQAGFPKKGGGVDPRYVWWLRNPIPNHRLDVKKSVNNWKNHEHQLVSRMSSINSILGDGFKYLFFTPKNWGNDPIWLIFCKWVGEKPPTRLWFHSKYLLVSWIRWMAGWSQCPKGRSGRTHGFGGRSCPRNTVSETLRHRWCLGNLHIGKPRVWALIQGPNLQPCHWKV